MTEEPARPTSTYIEPGAITSDPTVADRAMKVMAETGCTADEAIRAVMSPDEPQA